MRRPAPLNRQAERRAHELQSLASPALLDVGRERRRQISKEGYTLEHDDQHSEGQLGMAAAVYAAPETLNRVVPNVRPSEWRDAWPWLEVSYSHGYYGVVMNRVGYKEDADRRRKLVIAGALIVAEIERLDRKNTAQPSPSVAVNDRGAS